MVIVGGGPAGIATALFLVDAAPHLADRVVVLEKARYPREKICAGAIGARADALLARIGVVVDVPSAPIHGAALRVMGRTTVVREPGVGRVVRRLEFDAELARKATTRGIEVVEGAAVTAIRWVPGGIEVDSARGTYAARALVGADGVGSIVRRALGLPATRYHAQALEVDTEPVADDAPRDLLVFDAGERRLPGYVWDFPTLLDGAELVSRGVYVLARGGVRPRLEIQEVLERHLARKGLTLASYRRRRFAERGFEPHRALSRPRVLLVGEAAGIDPVTGEGIAQALFYGATAGSYLAARLAEGDLGFAGWPAAVRRSHVGRDLAYREKVVPLFYGPARPSVERFLRRSPDVLRLGLQHFGGKPWSRSAVARTGLAAAREAARYGAGRMRQHAAAR